MAEVMGYEAAPGALTEMIPRFAGTFTFAAAACDEERLGST